MSIIQDCAEHINSVLPTLSMDGKFWVGGIPDEEHREVRLRIQRREDNTFIDILVPEIFVINNWHRIKPALLCFMQEALSTLPQSPEYITNIRNLLQ